MACPDGLIIGNTTTSLLGVDLTHDWRDPDPIKNPVLYELKKHLKKYDEQGLYSLFFFLSIKTALNKPHTYFETNEYQSEDAFDRFLKIRFFPTIMERLNPIFNKNHAKYYPKFKFNSSFVTLKSELGTFFSY